MTHRTHRTHQTGQTGQTGHAARTVRAPGIILVEHEVAVPLDHSRPDGKQVSVFAREVADPEGRERPFLLFLQGGPGHEAERPTRGPSNPGWLDRALQDYRVLMLDQRGTGRSSPVGRLPGLSADQQAERLALFRADAIVWDAEVIGRRLGVDRWSVLGQSFGGFCSLRYLSAAPEALREAFSAGGLPPVGRPVDDVYRATYATMLERSRRYYTRYPQDRDRVRALHDRAGAGDLRLPNGDVVRTPRLRSIGDALGESDGAEQLHYLLELDPDSPAFRHDLAAAMPFTGRNPLYAVLHESCYADGGATRWSAQRTLPEQFREDVNALHRRAPLRLVIDEDSELAPLRAAADLLAEREWPALCDADVLRSVDVPCAAAVYAEDPYVDRALSEETAAMIPRMRRWVTNEHEHNGLRADGGRILDRLIGLARGRLA